LRCEIYTTRRRKVSSKLPPGYEPRLDREITAYNSVGPYTTAGGNFLAYLPLSMYSNNTITLGNLAASQNTALYLPNNTHATVLAGYKAQHELLTQDLSSRVAVTQEFLFNDGAIVPCLQSAFSRGSVTINSTSPFAPPVIDSRYLSNPLDIKLLVEGFKYTRTIRATNALQSISAVEIYPGGTVNTDEEIESFIRQTISTESHHAGTAAMLPLELGGVVDSELRVYGVKGLRVVDASVIPLLPAAHLQSTVYAVAEKAGDIILAS
jgi:choline dehydrogenase-like flavoprotein